MPPMDRELRDIDRETVTEYTDERGRKVRSEAHAACKGRGCESCNGNGFLSEIIADLFDNLMPES